MVTKTLVLTINAFHLYLDKGEDQEELLKINFIEGYRERLT